LEGGEHAVDQDGAKPKADDDQASPIRARFLWTFREFLDAAETNARVQCRPVFRFALGFACVVLIGMGFVELKPSPSWETVFAVAMIAVGSYILFFRKHDVRRALGRQFRRRPDKATEVVLLLSEEGVSNSSSTGAECSPWDGFAKVRKGERGYLLFPGDSIYLWLPFHAFGSVDDLVRADELIRRKVSDSAKVR
jgi:hypothetical protein